ncbi:MAG: hypothetical protein GY940_13655 [bacterium]|nr:hypothetical protein [bacterium]
MITISIYETSGQAISRGGTSRLWYTPEGIMEWLKTAPIPQLTEKEKEELGIE